MATRTGVAGSFAAAMLLVGACLAPPFIQAQTVRGTVTDESTRLPLASAIITLLDDRGSAGSRRQVRSDSLGRFTVHAGELGRYQIRVTRIGYRPLTSPTIALNSSAQVAEVTLGMTADTTRLGTVTVTGTTRLNTYELMSYVGFELRMSKGNGKFMDSVDLASRKRQPIRSLFEFEHMLLGLEIVPDRTGVEFLMMRFGALFCYPEVWIDGFEALPQSAVGRLGGLGADQVYGIEIYNSQQVPSPGLGGLIGSISSSTQLYQLRDGVRGPAAGSRMRPCGSVAVWTKAYARELQAKAGRKPPGGKSPVQRHSNSSPARE
jgi:hypothetical protein